MFVIITKPERQLGSWGKAGDDFFMGVWVRVCLSVHIFLSFIPGGGGKFIGRKIFSAFEEKPPKLLRFIVGEKEAVQKYFSPLFSFC